MRDRAPCQDRGLVGIESGLKSLINAQLLLGRELIKTAGDAFDLLCGIRFPKGHRCCDVPEPCWMPLSLGEICCGLRPGDSGTMCLVVTNGDFRPRDYQFVASGRSSANVAFSVASATLGPKERIAVTVTFTLPKDTSNKDCRGIDEEALIWVRGCRDHYLRWSVSQSAHARRCWKEVPVDDTPDYVLHWYDHFYLPRESIAGFSASDVGGTLVEANP